MVNIAMKLLAEQLTTLHAKHYGTAPSVIAYAPGRAEVLGNHTDYNQGTVLSTAIDKGHCFSISPNNGQGLRLLAGDLDEIISFDLDEVSPVENAAWASYVKGVFFFLKEKGLEICNWDCGFLGNIPVGSGLSSSAALEVASAYAAQEYTGQWLDKIEIAKLCRESEAQFAGCNCGLMDQFSSIYGKEHCLIHSDFQTLEVTPVAIPDEILFLMITPEVSHSLASSPYNERRNSCEQAVKELSELLPKPINFLREIELSQFNDLKDKIDPEAAKRAAHIVNEIDRVEAGVTILADGDIELFGELMYRSHESSRLDFENSCIELDQIVEAAKEAGALGARLSGGGWGGSLIVPTKEKNAHALKEKISKLLENKNLQVRINTIYPADGATIIQKKGK